jgi:hypothetical protein
VDRYYTVNRGAPGRLTISRDLDKELGIKRFQWTQAEILVNRAKDTIRMAVNGIEMLYYTDDNPGRLKKRPHRAAGARRQSRCSLQRHRIFLPDGFAFKRVELSDGLPPKVAADGSLLTVDYTSSTGEDVEWKVFF